MSNPQQLPLDDRRDAGQPAWYLLTNTLNLRAWMSRRMAFGRAGFDKYYADVPDLAGGCLVLFPGAPGADLIAHVTSEAPDLVPALVEVDPSAVPGSRAHPTPVAGVIHEGYLGPILLPDETAVSDFTSRGFENVPTSLHVVSAPDAFEGGRWSAADIEAEAPSAGVADLTRLDRLSGGMVGLAAATDCRPSQFGTLAAALSGNRGDSADPREPIWLVDDEDGSDEAVVFRAVRTVLLNTDPVKDWRPPDVIDGIQAAIESLPLSDEVIVTAGKYCERIRSILKAEADFEPLRPGGLRPLKAALLVLLRRELPRQLSWGVEETGAAPAERRTAAYYSGVLSRRSRLPLELRPDLLDLFLADWEAAEIGGPAPRRFDPDALRHEVCEVEEGPGCLIRADNDVLLTRALGKVSVRDRIRFTIASDDHGGDAGLSIAEAAGWEQLITTVVGPVRDVRLVAEKKGQVVLHIAGTARVRKEVDAEGLWSRLSEVADEDVPEAVVERLAVPSPSELDLLELEAEAP